MHSNTIAEELSQICKAWKQTNIYKFVYFFLLFLERLAELAVVEAKQQMEEKLIQAKKKREKEMLKKLQETLSECKTNLLLFKLSIESGTTLRNDDLSILFPSF